MGSVLLDAQEQVRVPRKVLVLSAPEEGLETIPKDQKHFLRSMPFFLFTKIQGKKPVFLTQKQTEANSTIKTLFSRTEKGVRILFSVSEKNTVQKEEGFLYQPGQTAIEECAREIERISETFIPFLDDVVPEITVERKMMEERRNKIIKEATFEDSLDKPYQLSLWMGGFLNYMEKDVANNTMQTKFSSFLPLKIGCDFSYYPSTNFGYIVSALYAQDEDLIFGTVDTLVGSEKQTIKNSKTQNLFTLGGVGIGYRTLGRVSLEFNMLLYLGFVQVTAKENVYYLFKSGNIDTYDKAQIMNEGDSERFFFSLFSIQPIIAFAITERLSLKTRLNLNFDPRMIISPVITTYPYDRHSNILFGYVGEIGVATRF